MAYEKKKSKSNKAASLNGPTHHMGLKDEMSQSYSRGTKKSDNSSNLSPRNKLPKARDY
jgi:hypothetical protein